MVKSNQSFAFLIFKNPVNYIFPRQLCLTTWSKYGETRALGERRLPPKRIRM